MPALLSMDALTRNGISGVTEKFLQAINTCLQDLSAEKAWQKISTTLFTPAHSFDLHFLIFTHCYPDWQSSPELSSAWFPAAENDSVNLSKWLAKLHLSSVADLHFYSVNQYELFWQEMITELGIIFQTPAQQICDLSQGVEFPTWLVGAKMNIAESCFNAESTQTAVLFQDENHQLKKLSYAQLDKLSNQIANSLIAVGYVSGDAIAIVMPMRMEAVAIYLGIIKMGGIVVSIADSFSAEEIAIRLHITQTKGVFTQDVILRSNKIFPLYEKIMLANSPSTVVLNCQEVNALALRKKDLSWQEFLSDNDNHSVAASNPMSACNILFSSGTTSEPKAIVWNHTTAIKAASDAYFHQNIQANDVLAWPTNLGWMMGPWLIFAALINKATITIYPDNPNERAFGEFIQQAKVTMLGVVPTLVASWRQSKCMQGLDWQHIKVFSSTGECSNPKDMLYLMSLAHYKPVIEYCGGTEIGGAYISSTVLQKNCPATFTTPAMGSDFIILDEQGKPNDTGEVALIPPAMGLATELLNADQYKIYYADMPRSPEGKILRRHGDRIHRYKNNYYALQGRIDDTMNLGGIKISSAEIERAIAGIEGVIETAAIAIAPPENGPSKLIIYAVTAKSFAEDFLQKEMQSQINKKLNPLFKIYQVILINELPKTASNKIMRRVLREKFDSHM